MPCILYFVVNISFTVLNPHVRRHPTYKFLFLIIAFLWISVLFQSYDAYIQNYRYYSVKTAYDEVRFKGEWPELEGCSPQLVYIVSRHGTRFNVTAKSFEPTLLKLRDEIISSHQEGKGCLSNGELASLERWSMRMNASKDMMLSETGWRELLELGQRLSERVPGLSTTTWYDVRHTNHKTGGRRSRDSARAFMSGVFGSYEDKNLIENAYPDWLLQYYVFCERYKQILEPSIPEIETFLAGERMVQLITNVTDKLGLGDNPLSLDTVTLLYEMCRFEYGIYRDSPWCSAFNTAELKLLEFGEDIRYYWKFGYGHSISGEQSCMLVKDLKKNLEEARDNTKDINNIKLVGRFGHSGTIQTFLTRLGFFYDGFHLKAESFVSQAHRKWRNSLRFPMAANIIFYVTSCSDGDYYVNAYMNEQPIVIPGCKSLKCPHNEFLKQINQLEDCDIFQLCKLGQQ